MTHVRYARGTLDGVREAVEIGRRAGVPVHISHLKGDSEAEAEAIIDYIDLVAINEVDFSFDVYPYMSSSTMLQYLLPLEFWADGVMAAYSKLADPVLRDRFQRKLERENLENVTIAWVASRHNSVYHGETPGRLCGGDRTAGGGCAVRPAAGGRHGSAAGLSPPGGWAGGGLSGASVLHDGQRRHLLSRRGDPPAPVWFGARGCWVIMPGASGCSRWRMRCTK